MRVLFKTPYFKVVEHKKYFFVAENCPGFVTVLPYRVRAGGQVQYLVRNEPNPCHRPEVHLTGLSGTIEQGEEAYQTALRALKEESGYWIRRDMLIELGMVYASKMMANPTYLFAADVSTAPWAPAQGDGTHWEAMSSTLWVDQKTAAMVPDASLGAALTRYLMWSRQASRMG